MKVNKLNSLNYFIEHGPILPAAKCILLNVLDIVRKSYNSSVCFKLSQYASTYLHNSNYTELRGSYRSPKGTSLVPKGTYVVLIVSPQALHFRKEKLKR